MVEVESGEEPDLKKAATLEAEQEADLEVDLAEVKSEESKEEGSITQTAPSSSCRMWTIPMSPSRP